LLKFEKFKLSALIIFRQNPGEFPSLQNKQIPQKLLKRPKNSSKLRMAKDGFLGFTPLSRHPASRFFI